MYMLLCIIKVLDTLHSLAFGLRPRLEHIVFVFATLMMYTVHVVQLTKNTPTSIYLKQVHGHCELHCFRQYIILVF